MIATDEEAFICDMAETYQILDYKRVPGRLLGTLDSVLRDDSRIKMKMSGTLASTDTILLANIMDCVQLLLWAQTEDGQHGRNKPKSIAQRFYARKEPDTSNVLTKEEYNEIRNKLLKKRAE